MIASCGVWVRSHANVSVKSDQRGGWLLPSGSATSDVEGPLATANARLPARSRTKMARRTVNAGADTLPADTAVARTRISGSTAATNRADGHGHTSTTAR